MLEKDLKMDLKKAIKVKDVEKKNAIKMILGEVPRLNKKKGERVSEEEISSIITKLIKSEITMLEYSGLDESKSEYLKILRSFLPKMMSEEIIRAWILDNIDFSTYSNNIQAMGTIMKDLKGKADGNIVRRLITEGVS